MKTFWINITNDCNLSCRYCYQKLRNKESLTTENAMKIIDSIAKYEEIEIIFFGGEPF